MLSTHAQAAENSTTSSLLYVAGIVIIWKVTFKKKRELLLLLLLYSRVYTVAMIVRRCITRPRAWTHSWYTGASNWKGLKKRLKRRGWHTNGYIKLQDLTYPMLTALCYKRITSDHRSVILSVPVSENHGSADLRLHS